jgi:thiamine biosynthesis lipoprotein
VLNQKKIRSIFFIMLLMISSFSFKPETESANLGLNTYKMAGNAQGTTYHITYYAENEIFSKAQADSIFNSLDSSLSIYKLYTLISKFNNEKRGVILDFHLKNVVQKALQVSEDSKGIFDITVMPLVNIWGFGPDGNISVQPTRRTIDSILGFVGYKKLKLEGDSLIKLHSKTTIDVNGIAQGYSVDVIADYFDLLEITNYLVEVGGEIRVKGRKQPGNEVMKIGIEAPSENKFRDAVILKAIGLKEGAVTTSGKYRKFYESGNIKRSHLIDPRTGFPLKNEMVSVTVYAQDAITADAYDNVLMGMSVKQALCFLAKHKNLEAYFIYTRSDGTIADTASKGFASMFLD